MMGFWNAREYVLHRDNHKCQNPNCKNKVKEQILQIHHIKFRNEGGSDAPSNLITLCTKCHTSPNHKQGKFLYDWCMEGKKVKQFKNATFMSSVRWYLINELKKNHNNIYSTYGYITKNHRIENGIEKTHYNDAFAITKGINQIRNTEIFVINQSILNIVRGFKQISTYRIWRQNDNHIYLSKQFWKKKIFWSDGTLLVA